MLSFLNNLVFTLVYPWPLVIVVAIVALVCLAALKAGGLDFSGACFAFILGTGTLWITRFEGLAVFSAFYVSSTLISSAGKASRVKKHGARNWKQVIANGLMAFLGVLIYGFTGNFAYLVMFAASVAEANSDTWAGETGRLSRQNPVSILTLRPVNRGLSGGVTVLGFAGGFAGSLLIAVLFLLLFCSSFTQCAVVVASGFTGCVLDSVLGASVQALYYDEKNGVYTEDPSFEHVRGLKWMDNSMVNLLSNIFSAVLAIGLCMFI